MKYLARLARLTRFVGLLMTALCVPVVAQAETAVVITHFNDVYQLQTAKGGLSRIATQLKRQRAEHPNLLVTFGGDALSPSVISSQFKGRPILEALGRLGVDVAVLGNHEFDFGLTVLRERLAESSFPWLATNVRKRVSKDLFPGTSAHFRKDVAGIRVCFAGLITEETPKVSRTENQLQFDSVQRTARRTALHLKKAKKCHAVIALTHLDMEDDRKLAASGHYDLILGGHDHYGVTEVAHGVPIFKAISDAQNLVVAKLIFDDRSKKLLRIEWQSIALDDSVPEDPDMQAFTKSYEQKLLETLSEVIAETSVPLDTRSNTVRSGEAPIGNLVADAYRQALQADIAIVNGGAMRSDTVIPAGPVRKLEVKKLLPFENKVVAGTIKGAQLQKLFESLGEKLGGNAVGRYPHVSGMQVVFRPKDSTGKRAVQISLNGQPLALEKDYRLAVSEYLAGGNDGYEILKQMRNVLPEDAAPIETEVVMNFVQKKKNLNYQNEQRLVLE